MRKISLLALALILLLTFLSQKKLQPEKAEAPEFNCQAADFSCISDFLKRVTQSSGPQAATLLLHNLQKEGKVEKQVDDHQLAHIIGRETVAVFGTDAKSFLLCPMADYNGGCQHGFFEHVLGKTSTAKEAAEACLSAESNLISSCMQSIGLMVSNPSWQPNLIKLDDYSDNVGISWTLCQEFPKNYIGECVIGAVDNIINFDGKESERAKNFCNRIDSVYKEKCNQRVGIDNG